MAHPSRGFYLDTTVSQVDFLTFNNFTVSVLYLFREIVNIRCTILVEQSVAEESSVGYCPMFVQCFNSFLLLF